MNDDILMSCFYKQNKKFLNMAQPHNMCVEVGIVRMLHSYGIEIASYITLYIHFITPTWMPLQPLLA